MKKIGDIFKMEPITRKAKNSQFRTCRWLEIDEDSLEWVRIESGAVDTGVVMLVVPTVDEHWDQVRWVQQKNDPDWKIV